MRKQNALTLLLVTAPLLSGCGPSMAGVMLANPGVVASALGQALAGAAITGAIQTPGGIAGRNSMVGSSQESGVVLAEASGSGMRAQVHSIGPSTWAQEGSWQEIRFTLTNTTSDDITVMQIQANQNGVLLEQIGPDYSPPKATIKQLFIPGYYRGREFGKSEAREEFQKRQVRQVGLAGGGSVTGSAFFPQEKSFSEIVFTVLADSRMKKIRVSLDGSPTKTTSLADSDDTEEAKKCAGQMTYRRTSSGYEAGCVKKKVKKNR